METFKDAFLILVMPAFTIACVVAPFIIKLV